MMPIAAAGGRAPLAGLRSLLVSAAGGAPRCHRCGADLAADHRHVADVRARTLLCVCDACRSVPAPPGADDGTRPIPERFLAVREPAIAEHEWDELQIPVGIAFLFETHAAQTRPASSPAETRVVACYPGAAGAMESVLALPLDRLPGIRGALNMLAPDVEALLVRRHDGGCEGFIVPIDACYELAGRIRACWSGFGGGDAVRQTIETFFADVGRKSRGAAV